MSFGSLRSLQLGINQAVHGVSATITTPGDPAIEADVIWTVEPTNDNQPYGTDLRAGGPRRLLTIAKADLAGQPPRGTVIVAPEIDGGTNKTWVVEGLDRSLADQWRVFVKLQN